VLLLSTLEIGHWAFPARAAGEDIQLHLFTELEICDLIDEHSFVSDFNVQFPISNNCSFLIESRSPVQS
jgi:hypothetical protein